MRLQAMQEVVPILECIDRSTYRYGGKNNVLNDVDTSSGGGATARVDISVNEQPTAAFLHVRGVHQVSVSQLPQDTGWILRRWTR